MASSRSKNPVRTPESQFKAGKLHYQQRLHQRSGARHTSSHQQRPAWPRTEGFCPHGNSLSGNKPLKPHSHPDTKDALSRHTRRNRIKQGASDTLRQPRYQGRGRGDTDHVGPGRKVSQGHTHSDHYGHYPLKPHGLHDNRGRATG